MKRQPKENRKETVFNYSKPCKAGFDKLEFAGSSMFGVIKKRKTQTLSYEHVFLLDARLDFKPKPTQIKLKETNHNSSVSKNYIHVTSQNIPNCTAFHSSSNISIETIPPNNSECIILKQTISQAENKKDRKMLSFQELLN